MIERAWKVRVRVNIVQVVSAAIFLAALIVAWIMTNSLLLLVLIGLTHLAAYIEGRQ